jgi:hypothetical protein
MKNYKNTFRVIVIGVIIGFITLSCGNPANNNNGAGSIIKAISAESVTYIMDNYSINRSARALDIGKVYEFTIIRPRAQNEEGPAKGFDTEKINVTVQSKEAIGNGRERYTLLRSDGGGTFFVTFDQNGEMYSIQGLAGAKDGFLTPIGNNSTGLDGVYVGFVHAHDYSTGLDHYPPMSFTVRENVITTSEIEYGDSVGGGGNTGTARTIWNITTAANTINFAEEQKRQVNDGEWETIRDDEGISTPKTMTYTLVGNRLTITTTAEWITHVETTSIGKSFEWTRVPTP